MSKNLRKQIIYPQNKLLTKFYLVFIAFSKFYLGTLVKLIQILQMSLKATLNKLETRLRRKKAKEAKKREKDNMKRRIAALRNQLSK